MGINRVISGGQTGADQAGWRAAKRFGIPTGGWMPKGFLTEAGKRPEFAELYGAKETMSSGYPERTRLNARHGIITLWFGDPQSRGGRLTTGACVGPWLAIWPGVARYDWHPMKIANYVHDCCVLNIAGNRESTNPGIGESTERYLIEVFKLIGFQEIGADSPEGSPK